MDISIVLRATDPARVAAIARAIGIDLRAPDRANPEAWHRRDIVEILVVQADEGNGPGLAIGPVGYERAVDGLEALGRETVSIAADGSRAVVTGPDGLAVAIERAAPHINHRPFNDVGDLLSVEPVFSRHREEIQAALREVGATNPRLVGRRLGRMTGERRWLLVVDAPEGSDLPRVDRLLARLGEGFAPVRLRRSADFEPDHLEEIDRLAFDI